MSWRNRIIGHGEETPDQLLANPRNWRVHPRNQQDALSGVLDEVGLVQTVIVNQRTGFVLDGHLRVAMAISGGQDRLPVTYIDVTEKEETLLLAVFDPLTDMAVAEKEMLGQLIKDVEPEDERVKELLGQIAMKYDTAKNDAEQPNENGETNEGDGVERYEVLVRCDTSDDLRTLYERLTNEGYKCHVR